MTTIMKNTFTAPFKRNFSYYFLYVGGHRIYLCRHTNGVQQRSARTCR